MVFIRYIVYTLSITVLVTIVDLFDFMVTAYHGVNE